MVHGDFKDLPRRTAFDKVLRDTQWFLVKIKDIFDKKSSNSRKGTGTNSQKQQVAQGLHKPIIKKLGKRIVYSSFKDNI